MLTTKDVTEEMRMSRIDNIARFAEKREKDEAEKKAASLRNIEEYKAKIRELKPRIDELLEVGNACLEHKIPLVGSGWGCHEGYDTHQFFSNGWSHLVGFVGGGNKITKVGKIGGGACDYNLITDGETIDVSGDIEYVLKSFVEGFDTFEKEFYAYVDTVTGK